MSTDVRRERDVARQALKNMAKALGLDASLSTDELIKQAQGLKHKFEQTNKAADFSHLIHEDKLKDCVIQVKIPHEVQAPPTKRTRRGGKGQSSSTTTTTTITKTVKAHSLILSSKSEYFKAALVRGQWAESQDKTIDIDLPSEEHFDTFKLLVELSYGSTCIQRPADPAPFERDVLIQLIVVANMFEFTGCVEACCEELKRITTNGNALDLIESLYHLQTAHDSINGMLDEAIGKLGALEKLWSPGTFHCRKDGALKAAAIYKIKAISSDDMLICILKSDKLRVYSENTTFTVVHWWIDCQEDWTDDQKQESFNKIHESGALRYHCMDLSYLAAYAIRCRWLQKDQESVVMQQAIFHKIRPHKTCKVEALPNSRGSANDDDTYYYRTSLRREDCLHLETGHSMYCFLGIQRGFPILTAIENIEQTDGGVPTFGLLGGWYGGSDLVEAEGGENPPIGSLQMDVELTPDSDGQGNVNIREIEIAEESFWVGEFDVFGAPWEEVVAEGSPYFSADGTMKMKFSVSLENEL